MRTISQTGLHRKVYTSASINRLPCKATELLTTISLCVVCRTITILRCSMSFKQMEFLGSGVLISRRILAQHLFINLHRVSWSLKPPCPRRDLASACNLDRLCRWHDRYSTTEFFSGDCLKELQFTVQKKQMTCKMSMIGYFSHD